MGLYPESSTLLKQEVKQKHRVKLGETKKRRHLSRLSPFSKLDGNVTDSDNEPRTFADVALAVASEYLRPHLRCGVSLSKAIESSGHNRRRSISKR